MTPEEFQRRIAEMDEAVDRMDEIMRLNSFALEKLTSEIPFAFLVAFLVGVMLGFVAGRWG